MITLNFDLAELVRCLEEELEPDFQLVGLKVMAPNAFYVEVVNKTHISGAEIVFEPGAGAAEVADAFADHFVRFSLA